MSTYTPIGSTFTFTPVDTKGNTICTIGNTNVLLATGSTGGFLYVPCITGAPQNATGVTVYTGSVALCYDTYNNMPWYMNPGNTLSGSTGPTGPLWFAGNGQVLIGKITVVSPTATISFTGVPQIYNHLRIIGFGRFDKAGSANTSLCLRFNGDTGGTNYERQVIQGNNVTPGASYVEQQFIYASEWPAATATANAAGNIIVDVPFYSTTTFHKNATTLGGSCCVDNTGTGGFAQSMAGRWKNTTSVTSIQFVDSNSSNFVAGTQFCLYGIF